VSSETKLVSVDSFAFAFYVREEIKYKKLT